MASLSMNNKIKKNELSKINYSNKDILIKRIITKMQQYIIIIYKKKYHQKKIYYFRILQLKK